MFTIQVSTFHVLNSRVGCLTHKHNTRQERPARDKQSKSLQPFLSYARKNVFKLNLNVESVVGDGTKDNYDTDVDVNHFRHRLVKPQLGPTGNNEFWSHFLAQLQ